MVQNSGQGFCSAGNSVEFFFSFLEFFPEHFTYPGNGIRMDSGCLRDAKSYIQAKVFFQVLEYTGRHLGFDLAQRHRCNLRMLLLQYAGKQGSFNLFQEFEVLSGIPFFQLFQKFPGSIFAQTSM